MTELRRKNLKSTRRWYFALGALSAALIMSISAPPPANATMKMQKAAKKAGIEAKNCLYCHNEKLPKKDAFTNNHRGEWLLAQKEERKAEEIDVAWLKDYVEPEEKK